MLQLLLVLLVGGFAGIMTGLMGASGVMAVVPGMILLGYSAHQAISTSLAVDMTASLVVALTYHKHGQVNLRQGLWIALAAVLGAQVGSHFSKYVPEIGLNDGFGIVLLLSAVLIYRFGVTRDLKRLQNLGFVRWLQEHPIVTGLTFGLYAGIYCGIFGAGGGSLFLFVLLLLGFSLHQAVGTSTAIMALTTASGTVGHAMLGNLPLLAVGGITTGTVLGSYASARLANRMNERWLGRAIALILGFLGVVILIVPLLQR